MTSNPQHHIYRVTYEAFAQFSSALTKTRNLDQVLECLEKRVKYLFDYRLLRINFRYQESWTQVRVGNGNKHATVLQKPALLSYEQELRANGVPKVWEVAAHPEIEKPIGLDPTKDKHIWGWHFKNTLDKEITISIVTGTNNSFTVKSIPFIRLFIELLESKLTEIILFDKLEVKNKSIQDSLTTIAEKNTEINAIMEHQDDVIKKQTADLQERNKKLVEISVLNAHSVREPLSRILGLANLMDEFDKDELATNIIPMIKKSSMELDEALKEVINMALNDIPKFNS